LNYYILTPGNLGPFDHYNPKTFIDIIDSFVLEFSLKHQLNHHLPTSSSCYNWKIYQNYNYNLHGPITASLDFDRGVCNIGFCNDYSVDYTAKYYWLNLIIFILGILQLIITCSSIFRRAALVSRIQSRQTTASGVWDSLEFEEKVKFINAWMIFTILGNISQILGCLNILLIGDVTLTVNETILGIGCFCSWINVLHYLKPYHNSYIVIDTLSRAFYRLGPYICGVLPIFIGFVFLAMCLFWASGNYPNLTLSMIVSFAMINGDTLYPFMSQNVAVNGFFGQLYCYMYLLFFIW
jgi:hypothetical protein